MMTRLINILFPDSAGNRRFDISLLSFRLLSGLLFMMHGLYKINDFDQMALTFPDPLGIGSELSLILAIFGEAFCSMMLILRLLTRLSLIPMMFTMCIAFLGGFMLEAHFQQKSDPLFIWQSLL
ncbi:DoxX family protein [Bacteroides acidifaciens]|uniref:DoxX family protein n=1 Tax=Bacteroidales TaxID=171549 RepID=UPI0025ADC547|nr:DoxX family protein [Bacteroides acidifaciens]